MTDDGPKRPNHKGKPNAPILDPELASEFMDILAQFPTITHAWNQLLKNHGTTIDVRMHEFFATQLHELGLPVSPELKDYLREHYSELNRSTRKKLFGNDLN
jgi:hypothetical protein